jgi:hypothetical protein
MPTQKTKLTIAQPHATGLLRPQMPTPSQNSQPSETTRTPSIDTETRKNAHQRALGASIGAATASVTCAKVRLFSTRTLRPEIGSSSSLKAAMAYASSGLGLRTRPR